MNKYKPFRFKILILIDKSPFVGAAFHNKVDRRKKFLAIHSEFLKNNLELEWCKPCLFTHTVPLIVNTAVVIDNICGCNFDLFLHHEVDFLFS